MHIEPGLLAQPKLVLAAGACATVLAAHFLPLLRQPALWLRTAGAALFFTLFMQSLHLPVGPSELHFVGAMPVYLAFGLIPTLFGFFAGLLLQALVFEPQDLVHLAVNTLSLAVPLLALHHTMGKRLAGEPTLGTVLKFDGVYYAGVAAMVGFWLSIAEVATPFADWAAFAASYVGIVAVEPVVTLAALAAIRRVRHTRVGALCFAPAR